jgi:hypothetical protein
LGEFRTGGRQEQQRGAEYTDSYRGGGISQVEEIRSGGSHLSQNETRVHFGLGKAQEIESVEVTWRSGTIDRMSDFPRTGFTSLWKGLAWLRPKG